MRKIFIIILCVSVIINILLGIIFLRPNKSITPVIQEYKEKIDSLEQDITDINTERDSVRLEIDTVYIKVKDNITRYEKTRNNIIGFTASEDYLFFTGYLEQNRQRYDNIDNHESAQRD